MGSDSKSSSSSQSTQTTDSNNQTLTSSLTGTGGLSVNNTGSTTLNGGSTSLDYAYGSNNPITNNDQIYNVGAGSSASPSNSSNSSPIPVGSSDIDWPEVITYIVAGIILVYVLRLLGDKNS